MLQARRIVDILLEGRFNQSDLEQTASAALIEPENFMDARSSDKPIPGRKWLQRRWDIYDGTLGGFTITLENYPVDDTNPDKGTLFEISYGFDTDAKYKRRIVHAPRPAHRRSLYLGLKELVDTVIPELVDRIDRGKCSADRLMSDVQGSLVEIEFSHPE